MVYIVGNEQALIHRVSQQESPFLVRAINDNELDQLLREGSCSFRFNRGIEFETEYGPMVEMYARKRNGTVVVYQLKEGDIGPIYNYNDNRRFDINGWARCVRGFNSSVEVYNVNGLDWQDLKTLRSKKTFLDEIAEQVSAELYAKVNIS